MGILEAISPTARGLLQTELTESTELKAGTGSGKILQNSVILSNSLPSVAISIRQPWAWLIVNGHKDIENRNWRTAFRGQVFIHASATMTREDYFACTLFISQMRTSWRLPAADQLERGGIVGQARITDCVAESDSPWFTGEYGLVIAEARPLPFRACKGMLKFFKPAVH